MVGIKHVNMEEKIYEVLRKHKLPLKKREELMVDLCDLYNVRLSFDEVKRLLYLAVKNSEKSKEVEGIYYSNDLKELDEYESLVRKYLGNEA